MLKRTCIASSECLTHHVVAVGGLATLIYACIVLFILIFGLINTSRVDTLIKRLLVVVMVVVQLVRLLSRLASMLVLL